MPVTTRSQTTNTDTAMEDAASHPAISDVSSAATTTTSGKVQIRSYFSAQKELSTGKVSSILAVQGLDQVQLQSTFLDIWQCAQEAQTGTSETGKRVSKWARDQCVGNEESEQAVYATQSMAAQNRFKSAVEARWSWIEVVPVEAEEIRGMRVPGSGNGYKDLVLGDEHQGWIVKSSQSDEVGLADRSSLDDGMEYGGTTKRQV